MQLQQTYYDQIVTIDQEDQLFAYTRTFFESDMYKAPIEYTVSEKKRETIKAMNERIDDYMYKI